MSTYKRTILLATADESVMHSLGQLLTENGYTVLLACNASVGLMTAQRQTPSLILVDRRLASFEPFRNDLGIRRVPLILFQQPGTFCDENECAEYLDRGVDAFLCNYSDRKLLAVVRAFLRRQDAQVDSSTYTVGRIRMNLDKHEVTVDRRAVYLTPKEFDILKKFLRFPKRVLTRQELFDDVWGEDYALEAHNLDVQIHYLRQKIEPDPRHPTFITTVRSVGYKLQYSGRRTSQPDRRQMEDLPPNAHHAYKVRDGSVHRGGAQSTIALNGSMPASDSPNLPS